MTVGSGHLAGALKAQPLWGDSSDVVSRETGGLKIFFGRCSIKRAQICEFHCHRGRL